MKEVGEAPSVIKGFERWDVKYFIPFFRKKFTQQEIKEVGGGCGSEVGGGQGEVGGGRGSEVYGLIL